MTLDPSFSRGAIIGGIAPTVATSARAPEAGGFVEVGARWRLGETSVQPFVAVPWNRVWWRRFDEPGARLLALHAGRQSIGSVRPAAGVRAARTMLRTPGRSFAVRGDVRVAREVLNDHGSVAASFADSPQASFTIDGPALGRGAAVATAGFDATLQSRVVVGAQYRAAFQSGYHVHQLDIGISF